MDIKNLVGIMKELEKEIDIKELEKILFPKHIENYQKFGSLVGISVKDIEQ